MKSSLLPEHYVVSPDLKVVYLEGMKPIDLFDTLVLPLNCVLDNNNQFKGLVLVCIGYDDKPHVFTVLLDDVLHDLKGSRSSWVSYVLGIMVMTIGSFIGL